MQVHHADITVSTKFRSTELEGFQSHRIYTNFYDKWLND